MVIGGAAISWSQLAPGATTAATSEATVRAYRMYLAGCAMSFERGWLSLYQLLAARPGPGASAEQPACLAPNESARTAGLESAP